MTYLRVVCPVCGTVWNYYETYYADSINEMTTAMVTQGCYCPVCKLNTGVAAIVKESEVEK